MARAWRVDGRAVVSVTDGIVRVHGVSDVMQGEMLEFPATKDGIATYGLALNLERDSVGAVILGEYEHISEGDTVKSLGRVTKIDPYDGIVEINTGRKVISLSYGTGA